MESLFHHTEIMQSALESYYDETLQDKVYTVIRYLLTTHDMLAMDKEARIKTPHILRLPPPDPDNFIPSNKVDLRVLLRWIHENEPNMIGKQKHNTFLLRLQQSNASS